MASQQRRFSWVILAAIVIAILLFNLEGIDARPRSVRKRDGNGRYFEYSYSASGSRHVRSNQKGIASQKKHSAYDNFEKKFEQMGEAIQENLLKRRQNDTDDEPYTLCTLACNETDWVDSDGPAEVTIGAYLTQITEVEPYANTFWATGYLWIYWPTCTRMPDGDVLLPHASTILENSAQDWAITLVADQARDCEDGETISYLLELCPVCDIPEPGYSEISFKFNSQFASAFEYKRYPVDFQELYIALENIEYDSSQMKLVPDKYDTQIHKGIRIPGFWVREVITRTYNSDKTSFFGDPESYGYSVDKADEISPESVKSEFSRVELGFTIQRETVFFVMKVLPPALINLAVAVMVLFIDPLKLDARLSTATSGLLTEVFLALGFGEKIPDVGVISVSDWVFNWCYLLILVIVVECVVISHWLQTIDNTILNVSVGVELEYISGEDENEKRGTYRKLMKQMLDAKRNFARRIDRWIVIGITVASTLGTIFVIIIAVYA